jgi:gas vesicle protein
MRKFMSFLAGVLCGALVGAVTAILLAPYSGVELQERIRAQVEDLVEKGRQAAMVKRTELEAQLDAFKRGESVVLQEPTAPAGES